MITVFASPLLLTVPAALTSVRFWVLVCGLAVVGLLVVQWQQRPTGRWVFKPLASFSFLMIAWLGGAAATPYGLLVLAGLLLCFFGDLLLILAEHTMAFQAGLASFLLAHITFAAAFLYPPPYLPALIGAAVLLLPAGWRALRWLRPHLPMALVRPVYAYVAAISVMVVTALGMAVGHGTWLVALGALLFAISDLAVARQQFMGTGFADALWGLPLYYTAALLLATSV